MADIASARATASSFPRTALWVTWMASDERTVWPEIHLPSIQSFAALDIGVFTRITTYDSDAVPKRDCLRE
jgi:hypothetical protein